MQLVKEAQPRQRICEILEAMVEDEFLSKDEGERVVRWVYAQTSGILDDAPVVTVPNQKLVLGHATLQAARVSPEVMRQKLDEITAKLQKRWCVKGERYQLWNDAGYARPPTQYLAYCQLQHRSDRTV